MSTVAQRAVLARAYRWCACSLFKTLGVNDLADMVRAQPAPLLDLKWLYDRSELEEAGFHYWRL